MSTNAYSSSATAEALTVDPRTVDFMAEKQASPATMRMILNSSEWEKEPVLPEHQFKSRGAFFMPKAPVRAPAQLEQDRGHQVDQVLERQMARARLLPEREARNLALNLALNTPNGERQVADLLPLTASRDVTALSSSIASEDRPRLDHTASLLRDQARDAATDDRRHALLALAAVGAPNPMDAVRESARESRLAVASTKQPEAILGQRDGLLVHQIPGDAQLDAFQRATGWQHEQIERAVVKPKTYVPQNANREAPLTAAQKLALSQEEMI